MCSPRQKSGMQIHMIQEAEFTDGVVAAGEVVGGILLTGDQLLRVEELAVGTRADLIDHGRLQVDLRNNTIERIPYEYPRPELLCTSKQETNKGWRRTIRQNSPRTRTRF